MAVNKSDVVTIDTILDSACCDNARPLPLTTSAGSSQFGRSRAFLRKAWGAVNKWALETLVERGTVDVSNFMRVGWQRFRALDGEMRRRPVFILSEAFCRAHGLPHKRILRPPLFKKAAEVLNYSRLAIRYTTSMTKDVIYVALRELFRRIGEAIASGAQVSVVFSFGTLEAKQRKFHFKFDCAALSGGEAATLSADTNTSRDGDSRGGEEWDRLSTSRSSSGLTSRRGRPNTTGSNFRNPRDDNDHDHDNDTGNQHQPDTPTSEIAEHDDRNQISTNEDRKGGLSGGSPGTGLFGKEFDEEVERQRAEEVAAERGRKRGSGKRSNTREKVWEYAFRDHVTALEGQAEDDVILATRTKNMQLAENAREAEERENKQREMHDLLTFVQGQIHEIEGRRAREVDSKRTGEEQLTFSARRDRACIAHQKYEGTAWRAPGWGPRRAPARNVSREELLGSLQRQIRERDEARVRSNRSRLLEEKVDIDQRDRDYEAIEERLRAQREEAQLVLKRSWERHGHLKRLRALAKVGPAAVRNYALSQNIINQDGITNTAEGRARAGWIEPGPRAITGPSKLYMKGMCKYRPCSDESGERHQDHGNNGGAGGSGDRPGAESGELRRPTTSHIETSSVGFDSRQTTRRAM